MKRLEFFAVERAATVAEAESWLGTPYHHHARIKAVGVDCAMLLCEVFEKTAQLPRIEPGHYPPQWGLHRGEEVFLKWIEACGGREVQTPGPGDIAVFRFGRTFSHGGIVVAPDLVVHAYIGAHVMHTRLTEEPLCGRPVRFYSLWV